MGYDPNAGTFRELTEQAIPDFLKETPGGVIFTEGETVNLKGCDFKVHEVGDSRLILKPIKKT